MALFTARIFSAAKRIFRVFRQFLTLGLVIEFHIPGEESARATACGGIGFQSLQKSGRPPEQTAKSALLFKAQGGIFLYGGQWSNAFGMPGTVKACRAAGGDLVRAMVSQPDALPGPTCQPLKPPAVVIAQEQQHVEERPPRGEVVVAAFAVMQPMRLQRLPGAGQILLAI